MCFTPKPTWLCVASSSHSDAKAAEAAPRTRAETTTDEAIERNENFTEILLKKPR
jgi:hypothetical protein